VPGGIERFSIRSDWLDRISIGAPPYLAHMFY
jgi:hypothetical protein